MTEHCLKLADSRGDADGVGRFLDAVTTVLCRSLCGVDWNLRDTAVEFIDRVFLAGWFCILSCLFVLV